MQALLNMQLFRDIANDDGGKITLTNAADIPPYYAGIHRGGVTSMLESVLTFSDCSIYKNILIFSGNCQTLPEWRIGNKITIGVDPCAWYFRLSEENLDSKTTVKESGSEEENEASTMLNKYGIKNIQVLYSCDNTNWFDRMRKLLDALDKSYKHRTLIVIDRSYWHLDTHGASHFPQMSESVEERISRRWEKLPEQLQFSVSDIVLICDSQQEVKDISAGIWFRKNLACLKERSFGDNQEKHLQSNNPWQDIRSIEIPSMQSSGLSVNLSNSDSAQLSIYNQLRTIEPIIPIIPKSPLKELDDMIGMGHLRETLVELENFIKIRQRRIQAGFEDPNSQNFLPHLALLGPPGVGKTTVARIIASIYYNLGLITKCGIREVTRSDLTDQYVGASEKKTRELFESAVGGVVFIDEAYSLDSGGNNDCGKDVINELVAWMNPGRGVVFILAGYEEPMLEMLRMNFGLESRVRRKITLTPYTDSELVEIAQVMADKQNYTINADANPEIKKRLQSYKQDCESSNFQFGNARIVETLVQSAIMQAAGRFTNDINADLTSLVREDFINAKLDSPKGESHESH